MRRGARAFFRLGRGLWRHRTYMDSIASNDASAQRLVGRYALVSKVVSGPLGDVHRARIATGAEEGRPVLVRLVPKSALDAKAVELLSNSGFASMELRDAKIAAVLDVAVTETEVALVSEHVGGTVLQNLLKQPGPKRVPATPAYALRIAADVLAALLAVKGPWAEIHSDPEGEDEQRLARGVFGGLAPDNLLVATFGETMLLEAGLGGLVTSFPQVGGASESIAYRAPEQLEQKTVDERADVFTVGVLVWELIAARSLFGPMIVPKPGVKAKPGPDPMQASSTKRKVLSAPIQRLAELPLLKGKVSAEVSSWVARCLERDPAARFQTAQEALEALLALPGNPIAPTEAVAKWLVQTGLELDLPASKAPGPPPPAESAKVSVPKPAAAPSQDTDDPPTRPGVEPKPSDHFKATTPMGVMSPVFLAGLAAGKEGTGTPPAPKAEPAPAATQKPPTDFSKTAPAFVPDPPPSTGLSADVESIPPSADPDSVTPLGEGLSADVESVPPSSAGLSADVESIPPSSAGLSAAVESLPPESDEERTVALTGIAELAAKMKAESAPESAPPVSDAPDAPTIPPAAPRVPPPPALESLPPESEDATTLPPPRVPSSPALAAPAPMRELVVTPTLLGAVASEEQTSAPVVSPIARPEETADAEEVRDARRPKRDSRKVVFGVLAAAALLIVIGGLRAVLGRSDSSSPAAASPSATLPKSDAPAPAAEPDAPKAAPAAAPEAPALAPRVAAPPQDEAAPTPSPAAADPAAAATAPRPQQKKRVFRPTGI